MKASYGPMADVDLALFIRLNRSTQAIVRDIQKVLRRHDLSLAQFAVLEALFHKGSLTTGEIMRSILTTGGNITIVLRNLEKKGLIQTQEDPADRRRRSSQLTKEEKEKTTVCLRRVERAKEEE